MNHSKIIIISGGPASMKTSIAMKLVNDLGYAYIGKDDIKEKLYDTEHHSTWDYGWFERKANERLLSELNNAVKNSQDVIVESNFTKRWGQTLTDAIKHADVTELHCVSKELSGFTRFVQRNEKGNRHGGHHDRRWYPSVLLGALLRSLGVYEFYPVTGLTEKILFIDTTNPEKIDYGPISSFIVS